MRLALAFILLSFGTSQNMSELSSSKEVAAQIDDASSRIFAAVPTLYSFEVSDALRRAAVRGVDVYVLVEVDQVETPDSFAPGLAAARLGGAAVTIKLAPNLPSVVLIDDDLLVEGPFIARESTPFDGDRTYVLRDPEVIQRRAQQLRPVWTQASQYTSFIEYFSIDPRRLAD